MQKKDVWVSLSLDRQSADILQDLAERVDEGNKSRAVRRLLKTAGQMMLATANLQPPADSGHQVESSG